jgi:hypothetical protein
MRESSQPRRKILVPPDSTTSHNQCRFRFLVPLSLILSQAMLLDRPHFPSLHPSSWKRWELVRSSAVMARREYLWQLQEPSQWRTCSASNSEIQVAHFWTLAMTGFERMPRPRSRTTLQQPTAIEFSYLSPVPFPRQTSISSSGSLSGAWGHVPFVRIFAVD